VWSDTEVRVRSVNPLELRAVSKALQSFKPFILNTRLCKFRHRQHPNSVRDQSAQNHECRNERGDACVSTIVSIKPLVCHSKTHSRSSEHHCRQPIQASGVWRLEAPPATIFPIGECMGTPLDRRDGLTERQRQLDRFWTRRPQPQTQGVDMFRQNAVMENMYVNPPFALIGKVLQFLRR